ncbi:MAG: hypothetical protein LUC18_01305, partial [Porphyromonadaceae bacterium]|nr:hypothetical protein [Porphyromonadaceae bacterium]
GYSPTDSLSTDEQPRLLLANCIVTSRSTLLSPSDIEGMNVMFDNCLFQVEGEDDENFVHCLWGEDPAFVSTGEDYIFDFRLTEESPARESGSTDYLTDMTITDLYGQPRPTDGTLPDIGASNYTPLETAEE